MASRNLAPFLRAEFAVDRVRRGGGFGGGIHFSFAGLKETGGQGFTGGSVKTLQLQGAVGATTPADVVVSKYQCHGFFLWKT